LIVELARWRTDESDSAPIFLSRTAMGKQLTHHEGREEWGKLIHPFVIFGFFVVK
jgi:hypothetical protein